MEQRHHCAHALKFCAARQPNLEYLHPKISLSPASVWRSQLTVPSHAAVWGLWDPFLSCSLAPTCWGKSKELGQTFSWTEDKWVTACASVKSRAREHPRWVLTSDICLWCLFVYSLTWYITTQIIEIMRRVIWARKCERTWQNLQSGHRSTLSAGLLTDVYLNGKANMLYCKSDKIHLLHLLDGVTLCQV